MNFIAKILGLILQNLLNLIAGVKKKVEEGEIKVSREDLGSRFADLGEAFKQGRDEVGYEVPDFKRKSSDFSESST
jgi:hypothetical protein